MPSPLFREVDCIRLSVKDPGSGIAFYHTRLGRELIWKTRHAVGLHMPEDFTEIVLHCEPNAIEIDLKVQSADEASNQLAGRWQGCCATIYYSNRTLCDCT